MFHLMKWSSTEYFIDSWWITSLSNGSSRDDSVKNLSHWPQTKQTIKEDLSDCGRCFYWSHPDHPHHYTKRISKWKFGSANGSGEDLLGPRQVGQEGLDKIQSRVEIGLILLQSLLEVVQSVFEAGQPLLEAGHRLSQDVLGSFCRVTSGIKYL